MDGVVFGTVVVVSTVAFTGSVFITFGEPVVIVSVDLFTDPTAAVFIFVFVFVFVSEVAVSAVVVVVASVVIEVLLLNNWLSVSGKSIYVHLVQFQLCDFDASFFLSSGV